MTRTTRRMGIGSSILALTTASVLALSGVAYADLIQDTIADDGVGISLVAGSATTGTATIKVLNQNTNDGDSVNQCNLAGKVGALVLDIKTPAGVSANPVRVSITACDTQYPVTFTASATAQSGTVTADVVEKPEGTFVNQVSIPITITKPNTKPTVAITGVTAGTEYKSDAVPAPGCTFSDAEDGTGPATLRVSNPPANGIGSHTVSCDYTDKGGLAADTKTVTYTVVAANTKPSVTVTGVAAGSAYEIGGVPAAICEITDAEDGNDRAPAVLSGSLVHGLGQQTATCDYTDNGALKADTASVTYTIVDTGKPTIEGKTDPGAPTGANGWYNANVDVKFTCADTGSGIDTCTGDTTLGDGANQSVTGTATDLAGNTSTDTVSGINVDSVKPTIQGKLDPAAANGANGWYTTDVKVAFDCADTGSGKDTCTGGTTLGEGAGHSVTGTATDLAGNTSTDTVSNIHIDKTAPSGIVVSGVSDYLFGVTPGPASCIATDTGSGFASCVVTGFGATTVGTHTAIATATDLAGLTSTKRVDYTVQAWKATGFYSPVDMGTTVNSVKGGSTVPLKFEAFGATEFTSTAVVKSFNQKLYTCSSGAVLDDIEVVSTGKTELRYDAVAGQFIQNWQTPKSPGACYLVTMTLQDGTSLAADFKLK